MQICTKVPKYAKICYKNRVLKSSDQRKTPFLGFFLHGIFGYQTCICMFCASLLIILALLMVLAVSVNGLDKCAVLDCKKNCGRFLECAKTKKKSCGANFGACIGAGCC